MLSQQTSADCPQHGHVSISRRPSRQSGRPWQNSRLHALTRRGPQQPGHTACAASAVKTAGIGTGAAPRAADPGDEAIQQWAQSAGIEAPKLRPADFAGEMPCTYPAASAAHHRLQVVPHACGSLTHLTVWHAGLRGMAARDSIAAGEVLASVPVTTALVVSPRERCSLPRDFCDSAFYSRQPWCDLPSCPSKFHAGFDNANDCDRPVHRYVQMALKLLHERRLGAASRLAPYVAALPQGFSTPLAWTQAQLAALQYPQLQQQVFSITPHSPSSPLPSALCSLLLDGACSACM